MEAAVAAAAAAPMTTYWRRQWLPGHPAPPAALGLPAPRGQPPGSVLKAQHQTSLSGFLEDPDCHERCLGAMQVIGTIGAEF